MITSENFTAYLLDWFDQNRRDLPWRQNRTAYGTWISETMLQQTRVATVIPYYLRFIKRFPDIQALAEAPLDEVYKEWEGLGYYSRANNLHKGAAFCRDRYNCRLPDNYANLLSIPGIGPYSAGAISSLAFGLCEPAVDGNAVRVFSRLYARPYDPQDGSAKTEVCGLIRNLLPEDRAGDFNEAVMDIGATICIPGRPLCEMCPLSVLCQAFLIGKQSEFPVRKAKKPSPVLHYTIVIIKRNDTLFIRRRPDSGLLANLFEFPSYPGYLHPGELQALLYRDFGIVPQKIESITALGGASHVFSHLKWEMEGYLVEISEDNTLPLTFSDKEVGGQYCTILHARKMAFPSAIKTYTSLVLHSQ